MERPAFTKALATLQAGDTLVFWKSDRWARSAAHVLTTINELRDHGVTVKSLTENFDLDTKEGRFMFAARRRQAEGRMLPGKKHIGRPRAVGPAELRQLQRMTSEGTSVTQAARILKVSRSTAYAALASTR